MPTGKHEHNKSVEKNERFLEIKKTSIIFYKKKLKLKLKRLV